MEVTKISAAVSQIVDLLEPFDATARDRIVRAALTILGETLIEPPKGGGSADQNNDESSSLVLSRSAKIWMKQNNVSEADLQQVFHISDGKADIIASEMPGKDGKQKTINAYILSGLKNMLLSGEPKFDDKDARALCIKAGAYSGSNHAFYMKGFGNKLSGTKDSGWTLTAPGLKHAADIVRELVS